MRYIGLDLGKKTLGISLSDKLGLVASFYKNLKYENEEQLLEELIHIINQEKIDKIVLGLPKNMDGTLGFRAKETIEFKEKLEKKTTKPILLEDERLTTVLAEQVLLQADLSRKKRKQVIDGLSAVVILQSFLDKEGKNGE
jgi:putative holliday junction resolvase